MNISQDSKNPKSLSIAKPWLNENGALKSDVELREIATEWTASTWEAYLNDPEVGVVVEPDSEKEILFSDLSKGADFSTDKSLQNFISNLKVEYFPTLRQAMKKALLALSVRQYEIIRLYFWIGLNQYQIAAALKISQPTVFNLLNRGLRRVRSEILKEIGTGEQRPSNHKEKGGRLLSRDTNQVNSNT